MDDLATLSANQEWALLTQHFEKSGWTTRFCSC